MTEIHTAPVDAQQRATALEIDRSFIVQAPAGSGKTELLTQRFLKLLATVDRPERLLAITFTRKATQEMRERILHRLRQAASGEAPNSEHERLAIELAQQALQRDATAGWNLLQNPGRLRVLTIDGLCAQFLARDPKLGGLGAGLAVQEIAEPLYREAVECLFEEFARVAEAGEDWSKARRALSRVLYLLDGDAQQLRKLLVNKLQARDQWVDRIGMDTDSLAAVIAERQATEFHRFEQSLGAEDYEKVCAWLAELGAQCTAGYPPAKFAEIFQAGSFDLDQQIHQAWLFSKVFVVGSGALRKPTSLTRSVFKDLPKTPECESGLKRIKEQFEYWAAQPEAAEAIERMAKAPPLELGNDTEALQQDITLVLMHALARLRVLFHDKGECDFHYMTELALDSLGEEDNPGSLLLAEDARIEHILMDEFQDTSNTQFKLLRRLMSGWNAGGQEGRRAADGRSLFLVGDPMQSIYRFRQANVGLFIDVVQQGGLGNVPLDYLQLQSNFRSRTEVVAWVNQQFAGIFPRHDERDSGAVRYARAAAEQGAGGNVQLHAFPPQTPNEAEAQRVVELVHQAQGELDNPSIGILARTRKIMEPIARALQQAGIATQAVKIDELQAQPVVCDLLSLTRALSHPGDRIAWLAVMRAPWAGFTVAELHQLVHGPGGRPLGTDLLTCLQQTLDEVEESDFRQRLVRLAWLMTQAEAQRGQRQLRQRVETAWIHLGGPWCYASAHELNHASAFLDLLDELERESSENLETRLAWSLEKLYASSAPSKVKLMTIHQAKGLEFDIVIVPGMGKAPRGEEASLVALQEFHNPDGSDRSLLAPIPSRIKPEASLYAYLRAVETERNAFEQQRLLYVACTRARQQLHLLGNYSESKGKGIHARSGTFMELLFPAFNQVIAHEGGNGPVGGRSRAPALRGTGASLHNGSHAADIGGDDTSDEDDTNQSPISYPLLQLQGAPLYLLSWRGTATLPTIPMNPSPSPNSPPVSASPSAAPCTSG
jgi:ATP-dependent exoDNAse (exonuclease V) beta subunit